MKRLLVVCVVVACALLSSVRAEAACTGAGLTWTCTSGTTAAQVNTALSSGTDGMTLTFDAGSYTWGGGTRITFSATKGVTLICATVGACAVTAGNQSFEMPLGDSTKLYRISGFELIATSGDIIIACFNCTNGIELTQTQFRLDHNTFTIGGAAIVLHFAASGPTTTFYFYGLVDNNIFNVSGTQSQAKFDYFPQVDSSSPLTRRLGSANNLFFEDNIFTIADDDSGYVPCLDVGGTPAGVVWRFNTMITCRIAMHGVSHQYGPSNWEVYGNTFDMTDSDFVDNAAGDGYRTVQHQGSGTYGVWNNRFTSNAPHNTSTVMFQHYRSGVGQPAPESVHCNGTVVTDGNRDPIATYRGYPCKHQVSRDNDGVLFPIFAFLNSYTHDGSKVDAVLNGIGGSPDYSTTHLQANRDYYNAVSKDAQTSPTSPFNGTTGIGYGTLANRPTTCTPTPEALDAGQGGVMYWATDQGSWNKSASNPRGVNVAGADGVLYHCSATNTWSVYYTPYDYPHPLQGGVVAPPAPVGKPRTKRIRVALFLALGLVGLATAPRRVH